MAIYTIQLKRGKSADWISKNILLNPGEPGFELDTGKLKIGNGQTLWNDLPYVGEGSDSLIFNALTVEDFPEVGNISVVYKASQENRLYQWNEQNQNYVLLFSEDYLTQEDLYKDIELILENYSTTTFVQELYDNIIALSEEEILEICK